MVSRLERIDADLPLNTNFYATHNFSALAETVNDLPGRPEHGGSFGKGSTAEQGEASALMEAIERYSGVFQGDEIQGHAAVKRLSRRAMSFVPNKVLLV